MKKDIEENHLNFYRRWGRLAKPYFKWQMQQFSGCIGQKIGDVGCGLGSFVEFFREKELYLGFETDPELVREFNLLHKAENVRLAVNGDICSAEAVTEMRANRLDTLICINVLEHIKNDKRVLSNLVDGVSSKGHVCVIVPAFSWLYGSLDALDKHYRRYSKEDLLRMTEDLKVIVSRCYYMNFPGGLGWFIKGRILKEKRHADINYTVTNMILPIVSFAESIIKPPFGLSLVAVLRKK